MGWGKTGELEGRERDRRLCRGALMEFVPVNYPEKSQGQLRE